MSKTNDPSFKQSHVRVLREALAKICRAPNQQVALMALNALSTFSRSIQSYCQCPEKSYLPNEKKQACLDCGKRHEIKMTMVKPVVIEGGKSDAKVRKVRKKQVRRKKVDK